MNEYIYLVEKNIHGAIVIYGALGIKHYYYHTEREAVREYIAACKREIFTNRG